MARSRRSRQAGVLAAALTALAVAGCGSVSAATTGSASAAAPAAATASGARARATSPSQTARPALCARPGASRRVIIERTGFVHLVGGGKRARLAGSIPPQAGARPVMIAAVTSSAQVHALARALCALPRLPRGPLNCPALFPGSYQFFFTASGRRLPAVVVQETGCRTVTGLGPVRWAEQPGFWRLLDRIVSSNPGSPAPRSPFSVQPGGPELPGSGLRTACLPRPGQPPRACPF